MDDLIFRKAAIEAAIDGADDWDGGYNPNREEYIRKYMEEVPAVDAIPVEWLRKKCEEALHEGMRPDEVEAVEMVMWMWQNEQEAR